MKDVSIKVLVFLFIIGSFLWLFSTLEPWFNELNGETERQEQAKLDVESCPGTQYHYIDDVLYCDYQGNLYKPKVYKGIIK